MNIQILITLGFMLGCSMNQVHESAVSLEYAGGDSGLKHMLLVPVTINSTYKTNFIFDTGIGVNLLSKELCQKFKCEVKGEVRGKRMTGQEIIIPMSEVHSIQVANVKKMNVPIANWDVRSMLPKEDEFQDIGGYLSLTYFMDTPFTIDYRKKKFVIDNEESLEKRLIDGETFPLKVRDENGAKTVSIHINLPSGESVWAHLDLGTNIMTLSEKYQKKLNLLTRDKDLKKTKIKDETGFTRTRYYSKVSGRFLLLGSQSVYQNNPIVMFQNIIHDGVIGNDFFKDRVVTYDLKRKRIIIEK